ncbi:MAG TPA: hypothetical protein VLT90_10610 [Terriglobales bacterium]|nr:hypothetical protein [Terriglobales bacterium]
MTCHDVQRVLPEMMDGQQNAELQAHLRSCPACEQLVSELGLIAVEARQLAAIDEPAPRVWVNIANQLRAEGIIREPEAATARPVLVPARRRLNLWWLAPVAAALLASVSYYSSHRTPTPPVAVQTPQATVATPDLSASNATPKAPSAQRGKAAQPVVAKKSLSSTEQIERQIAPMETVSNDDNRFLNRVGRSSPDMRATFESQLKAVNAYIKDVETYLKRNPDDEEARQQLMDAYEQKAMLYQMAMDHVQ